MRTDLYPKMISTSPRPSDIGGKMKWKLTVRPNWMRCRSSVVMSSFAASGAGRTVIGIRPDAG